jgi:hypothetical protein
MPNTPSTDGSTGRERMPYHTPEVRSFGSIADITAGSGGPDYNPYGGSGGNGTS